MKYLVSPALLLVLLSVGCENGPNPGTLRHSFYQQIVRLHAIGKFEIKNDVMTFEYLGDEHKATLSNVRVEPNDDSNYPMLGFLDCQFSAYGEPVEFDAIRRADIDPDNIIAIWNKEKKRWEWTIQIQPEEEY